MGGTDLMNQDINRYRVSIRGKKWWWSVFTWFLDASITNAWRISRSCGSSLSQLQFRRDIAIYYLKEFGECPRGGGRPSNKSSKAMDAIRLDGKDHFVVPSKRRRCAGMFCKKHPLTSCEKCDVGLCTQCFKAYHKE